VPVLGRPGPRDAGANPLAGGRNTDLEEISAAIVRTDSATLHIRHVVLADTHLGSELLPFYVETAQTASNT